MIRAVRLSRHVGRWHTLLYSDWVHNSCSIREARKMFRCVPGAVCHVEERVGINLHMIRGCITLQISIRRPRIVERELIVR